MRIIGICRVLIALSVLWAAIGFAQPGKILIINSGNDIYRFSVIAATFKEVLEHNKYQWVEYDLFINAHNGHDVEADLKALIRKEDPALIFCIGSKAYLEARKYTPDKKLLFSGAINWQNLDIDNRTFGVANDLLPEQEFSILSSFFPKIKKIGLLYSENFTDDQIEVIQNEALEFDISITSQSFNDEDEISVMLDELLPEVDMLWIAPDPLILQDSIEAKKILLSARNLEKPVLAYSEVFVEKGAAIAIALDNYLIGEQSAGLAMALVEDKLPVDRVESPADSVAILNKCVLDALDIEFNPYSFATLNKIVDCENK